LLDLVEMEIREAAARSYGFPGDEVPIVRGRFCLLTRILGTRRLQVHVAIWLKPVVDSFIPEQSAKKTSHS
jgi:translation elongation factor EF-Tu-like GTPase